MFPFLMKFNQSLSYMTCFKSPSLLLKDAWFCDSADCVVHICCFAGRTIDVSCPRKSIKRSPKFGSFDANMKIIDDINQSKIFDWLVHFPYIFQSFSGTGDLPQPTTEPSHTEQHCHLLFSQFSSWQKCFLPRVINWVLWIAGICLSLGWKFVRVGQRLPPTTGKAEQAAVAAYPSCLSSVVSAEFLSAAGHFQLGV